METYPAADRIVTLVRSLNVDPVGAESDARYNDLVRKLQSNTDLAKERLQELTAWPESLVRTWVAASSGAILGTEAKPILDGLMLDRDPTVQQVALASLMELDRDSARRHLPQLRSKLRSGYNRRSPTGGLLQVIWTILRLQDRDSIADLRLLTKRKDVPEWLVRTAGIAADYLEQGEDSVYQRIRAHDHDNMLFSCRLAWRIGSREANAALAVCVETAPDEECRVTCQKFKDALEKASLAHHPPYWDLNLPF